MAYDLTIPVGPTVLSTAIIPLKAFSAIQMQNVKDPAATGGGFMDFVIDPAGRAVMLIGSLVKPFLAEALRGAIGNLKVMKDTAALDQPVQDVERIGDMQNLAIQILRNTTDPRFWDINISIPVLAGGDPLETELSLLGG
jgi:hypothetical protein